MPIIKIDDKDYDTDNFSDEAKMQRNAPVNTVLQQY